MANEISNISTKFRDAFESYDPVNGSRWREVRSPNAAGDLVYVDGNALSASYLVISKDPLTAGNELTVEGRTTMLLPVEMAIGLSLSQRTLGQEFALELVDVGPELTPVAALPITTMTHGSGTLTITTAASHGLAVGKSVGITDCVDSRFNYPALVVSAVPAPNQITCTAGPGGTIPAITATATSGVVFFRERLGRAQNGVSQIFENATVTNASLYMRSESGDALPTGTALGNHSTTVGTTASVQLANTAYTYAFSPSTEFRCVVQVDRTQWSDATQDSITAATHRQTRSQVCPDPTLPYKFRIRTNNSRALTIPSAEVVSVTKSGTTTGTFITATAHNLITGDVVVYYGSSDQAAANFPALVTATAVTVVDATTFTAVIGTGTTGAAYGGFVAKVQGGNLGSSLGYNAIAVTSTVLSTLVDGTRQLVLTGSGNWAGLLIGDLVNILGLRSTASLGVTSLGVDGAWKVANVATTALTLVLPFNGQRALPADFGATNSGGGVIKRTDLRVSYVRLFDYERKRVELLPRPSGDASTSAPVTVQNTVTTTFTQPALVAGTALVGDVGVQYRATASGASALHFVAAASTNATLVKSSAGKVLGWFFANTTAAWVYVKLHNQTTAPTAGTGVVRTIGIPPNNTASFFSEGGITFATGIGLTAVTGAADADATAVAAASIVGELIWA